MRFFFIVTLYADYVLACTDQSSDQGKPVRQRRERSRERRATETREARLRRTLERRASKLTRLAFSTLQFPVSIQFPISNFQISFANSAILRAMSAFRDRF